MTDIIAPEMRDPTLSAGAFVLLSIDPVASVADLQDAKATAAAARLRKGVLLVMVRRYDIDQLKPFYTQPLAFDFLCIGHGLPAEPPYACIGLSKDAEHPDSQRAPLLPSVPLPWSDCYLHLFAECGAIVTRIHPVGAAGMISRIPEPEILRAITVKFDDHARYGDEVGSAAESEWPGSYHSGESFELQSDVVVPVSDAADDASANCHSELSSRCAVRRAQPSSLSHTSPQCHSAAASSASGKSVSDDEECCPVAVYCDPDAQVVERDADAQSSSRGSSSSSSLGDIQRLRYRGEVWLYLTAFDDFDPPEYIARLMESLEEIEREWANRMALKMLADQPLTAKWASEVAAAGAGDSLAEPLMDSFDDSVGDSDISRSDAGDVSEDDSQHVES